MAVPIIASAVAFVVALLVGGLAIYISARVITRERDDSHAVITALIGTIAWSLTAWIPLFGRFIALVVWVGIIN
jgi:hypothetical protein